MHFVDVALNLWAPNENSFFFRQPPRNPMGRAVDYEDRFDFTTVFYDSFWSEDGREILIVCPPPLNLTADILKGEYFEVPSGAKCEIKVEITGPIHVIRIPVSEGAKGARLVYSLGEYYISPQQNFCDLLAGERLLVTQSKNNPLHWIQDWVFYYVKVHKCSSVVFYDNASEFYSKYDLRDCMAEIPGLNHLLILDWPSAFGPPPSLFGENDSRYLQRGMLEHVRYRFANKAASVIHVDVDEVVVSKKGESIMEAVENSKTGYLSFEGVWVERVTEDGIEPPVAQLNHRTFQHIRKGGGRRSAEKWCVAPPKLKPEVYWTTHRAYRVVPDADVSAGFSHRHQFGLKTFDTDERNKTRLLDTPLEEVDPSLHEKDILLASALSSCFEADDYRAMRKSAPYREPTSGAVCRKLAGDRLKVGDMGGALYWAQRATALEPTFPSYWEFLAKCLSADSQEEAAAAAAAEGSRIRAGSPEYRAWEVRQLRFSGKRTEAIEAARALVAWAPDSAEGHFQYGDLLSALRDPAQAELSFRRAVELDPENTRLLFRWATELHGLQQYDAAADAFQRMLVDSVVNFYDRLKAYRGLSAAHEGAGRPQEAVNALKEACEKLGSHGKMTNRLRKELNDDIERLTVADQSDHRRSPRSSTR